MAAVNLPNDVARCPGRALINRETAVIYAETSCDGCHRLIAAREDTRAWIKEGRQPFSMDRVAWMLAPLGTHPCPSRIDTDHPHAVDHDRRAKEKSPTGCNRSGLSAA